MDCSSFRRPFSAPLRASGGGVSWGQNAVQSKKLPTSDGGRADSISLPSSRTHPRPLSASSHVSFSDSFADAIPSHRSLSETTRVDVKRGADAARLQHKKLPNLQALSTARQEPVELQQVQPPQGTGAMSTSSQLTPRSNSSSLTERAAMPSAGGATLSRPGSGLSRMVQDEIHELRRLMDTKSLELRRLCQTY
jgi:hypothetical protein